MRALDGASVRAGGAIMFQGTGSDVGKSVLVAGLCRVAARRGLRVLPFKPQNMSNNAAVAELPGGGWGEIGRAQWLQALACGVQPLVDMNPVLLKPQSETGSQVVVHGKPRGVARGRDYQRLKRTLLNAVLESFERLRADADLVLVEGAGSPAEVNLRSGDIANMGFATAAGVPVVLVGDIDRGGVIASLVGTHAVIAPDDRRMVRGFLINKFRGDVSLFDEGLRIIEEHTGWRSFGVIPWLADAARLPAEDSVALTARRDALPVPGTRARIAVPVLDRIANFDDLDPLIAEPGVEVMFVRPGERFPSGLAAVVIPGSKSTIGDLRALQANGWDEDIRSAARDGAAIVGLCGGFQMLGTKVSDPHHVEGGGTAAGLGLLDVETVMGERKTVRPVQARGMRYAHPVEGYEIHMGETAGEDMSRPSMMVGGRGEGAQSPDGRVWATYLHGVFGSGAFRAAWLAELGVQSDGVDHRTRVEAALDDIAERLEDVVDVDALLDLARCSRQPIR